MCQLWVCYTFEQVSNDQVLTGFAYQSFKMYFVTLLVNIQAVVQLRFKSLEYE